MEFPDPGLLMPIRPEILFVGPTKKQERDYLKKVFEHLRGQGYTRYVEPCVGSFAMTSAAISAGYTPEQIDTSDVTLFSSVLGYLFAGKDLAELDVRIDGEPVHMVGNPFTDATMILIWQLQLRMEMRPEVDYWREIKTALRVDGARITFDLRSKLHQWARTFEGIGYRPMDIYDHVAEVAGDENTIVYCAPPSYNAGYERFYDTGGRLTWNEPNYGVFDPEHGVRDLLSSMESDSALLIMLEERPTGSSSGQPLYARQMGPGRCTYVLSNRPQEVLAATGSVLAEDRGGWHAEPLKGVQIIELDHHISEKSRIDVGPIHANNSLYYRDLWMHKIDYKPAHNEFAVYIDGRIAGIAGYDTRAVNMTFAERWRDALILTYAVGAPHNTHRLTKLVTMLAMSRAVIDKVVPPWAAVQAKQVMTTAFTKQPESKGLRGIMKLVEREPDKKYGNRLVYAAEVREKRATPKAIFKEWLQKGRKSG